MVGGTLYAANYGSNAVTPISLANAKPGTPIPVGSGPVALAVAGRTLYVANHGDGTVTAVKIG